MEAGVSSPPSTSRLAVPPPPAATQLYPSGAPTLGPRTGALGAQSWRRAALLWRVGCSTCALSPCAGTQDSCTLKGHPRPRH